MIKKFWYIKYFLFITLVAVQNFLFPGVGGSWEKKLWAQMSHNEQFERDRTKRPVEGQFDFTKEIKELVEAEKQATTTSQNAQERFMALTRIISSLLQSGRKVENILSKQEGERIRSLLKEGNLEEAASGVHDAIMRLENFAVDKTNQSTVPEMQKSGGMQKGKLGGESTSDSVKQKLQQEPLFTGQKEALVSSPSITKLNINQVVNQNCFPTILKQNPLIRNRTFLVVLNLHVLV